MAELNYTRKLTYMELVNVINICIEAKNVDEATNIIILKMADKNRELFQEEEKLMKKAEELANEKFKQNKKLGYNIIVPKKCLGKNNINFSLKELRAVGLCFICRLGEKDLESQTKLQIWELASGAKLILRLFIESHAKLDEYEPLPEEFFNDDKDLILNLAKSKKKTIKK